MRPLARIFLLWLALSAFFQLPRLSRIIHMQRLADRGATVLGVVTGTTYHQEITFAFTVDGHTFSGAAQPGVAGIPRFIRTGDSIPVRYLATDPSIHAAGDVQELLHQEYMFRIMLAIMAFAGVIMVLLRAAFFPNTRFLGVNLSRWVWGDTDS